MKLDEQDDELESLVAVESDAVGSAEAGGSNRYVFVLTALSAIGGFLFGYDTGVISGAMLLLVEDFGFDHKEQEMIVSVTLVGCIVAAVVASVATEKLGRQPVILLGSAIFAGASLVLATAATFERLLLGRFVVGIAVGLASMAVPVYVRSFPPDIACSHEAMDSDAVSNGVSRVADRRSRPTRDAWQARLHQ